MRVSRLFQSLLSVSLAASLMVLSFSSVQALERVRWKMQSAWGSQVKILGETGLYISDTCLLYTSPSPRDTERSRMPSSA